MGRIADVSFSGRIVTGTGRICIHMKLKDDEREREVINMLILTRHLKLMLFLSCIEMKFNIQYHVCFEQHGLFILHIFSDERSKFQERN